MANVKGGAPFNSLMTLTELSRTPDPLEPPAEDVSVYRATIADNWTIGPKVHGGTMLALCAKAAQYALGAESAQGARGAESAQGARVADQQQPVAVSASFLHAPDPGEVQLTATVLKRGRRVSLVEVEL